jgi:XTP/dITP diphosphohydrolase
VYSETVKLLLATSNNGKVTEMREALNGMPFELLDLSQMPPPLIPSPDETASTYHENAILKAKHYFDAHGIPTVADDSGIVVEALQDELGVQTRRWGAGADATDAEWIEHFLDRMKKEKNKRAKFLCAIAHVDTDGTVHVFEGTCDGTITEKLEADYLPGLPISACFRPDGCEYVFSALPIELKNSVSHRGRALKEFRGFLQRKN